MQKKQKKEKFLDLIEPLKDSLYRYSKNMLWDKNDVEDVLQSSIFIAYKSFGKYSEGTNFKAWIFAYLTNTIFNFNKRYEKINKSEIKLETDDFESIAGIFEQEAVYLAILEEPQKLFDKVGDKIKHSLTVLSCAERSVFLLRAIEDLSYKEISEVLKTPIGTVMSHLSRSRMKLRKLLCDYAKDIGFIKK